MPLVETSRFGPLEFDAIAAIEFPCGIPGFALERRFVLVEQAALAPLVFLQSLETPDLCFPAVPAGAIDSQYQLEVLGEDLELLGMDPTRQPVAGPEVLCLAIVAAEGGTLTANLLAPVVINLSLRVAVQAVRSDTRYSHRHPLGEAELMREAQPTETHPTETQPAGNQSWGDQSWGDPSWDNKPGEPGPCS